MPEIRASQIAETVQRKLEYLQLFQEGKKIWKKEKLGKICFRKKRAFLNCFIAVSYILGGCNPLPCENLGVIIRIGEACVFCHDADLRSFAEILQTSLNAVFLKISK